MVEQVRNRPVTVDSTTASMSGVSRLYSPVISMMRTIPVIGARAAPENTAPIPSTPKTAAAWGRSGATKVPKHAPSMPPMNNDGAKTPPGMPTARVTDVATIFARTKPARTSAG